MTERDWPVELARFSMGALEAFLEASERPVVLFPVGSVEAHGPHLPLWTDWLLAYENARRAALELRTRGVPAVVAPTMPYAVTDFTNFTGSTSVPAGALTEILVAAAGAWLRDGFAHVCLINHHLDAGQVAVLAEAERRIAADHGADAVSAPRVVSRRWGGRLGDEFRSGACHAGRYETSMVLAIDAAQVDGEAAAALREVPVSLSEAMARGVTTMREAGADAAYTGAPAQATGEEGEALLALHTEMVVTEVLEHLQKQEPEEP